MPRKVPLVRVEGFPYDMGMHASPQQLVADPHLLRRFKNRRTTMAEEVLDLGDCLYFYAGYACPDFGDMALVYDPAMSAQWQGSATPFDTGGIIGYIRAHGLPALVAEQRRHAAPLTEEEKDSFRRYVRSHRIDLGTWLEAFERFLDAHYEHVQRSERAAGYVRGERPSGPDPTNRHGGNDDRRAWTWEIQAHRDHGVLDGLWLLCMTSEKRRQFLAALESRPDDPWWAIVDDRSIFLSCLESESANTDVCRSVERAILSWL
jgi:hypothetical protein